MCLLENAFWFTKFLRACKNIRSSEPCKISELLPDSHCAINMMLIYMIYKTTEVKLFVSLCEHHDVLFAENDTAAYTPCL